MCDVRVCVCVCDVSRVGLYGALSRIDLGAPLSRLKINYIKLIERESNG